ncbi:L-type lectin-domain containing receptor kinase VII.1 [Hibiscus syriacus]|uniref:non-specific serine/threonine protein kinase n=1 Tax=Hibiscus syriacus TaxID=106335 RepID=A0A6A2Y0F9_HIBSY|nr:probable L-type lectin-domain containing receptor kinase VII.2 [Hibiscus syriacus]KAE8660904.1 L-type lectin-domain containing receptor kinase VII.1 [Hibiscus syriacus]
MSHLLFSTAIITLLLFSSVVSSLDFVYNTDFNSTNLFTFGDATIDSSSILSLTNATFSIGRALYPLKIPVKSSNSSKVLPFSTSFIFAISPLKGFLPGHGFAFAFLPSAGISGASSAQNLGLFNFTNNGDPNSSIFGVEFDVFANQEFDDINDNHVGVDLNSLKSVASSPAGFWGGSKDDKLKGLKLNNGVNYQVWIDYHDSIINVSLAKVGDIRPRRPLISAFVNLSGVFLDEMHVGFAGSTGQLVESHRILAWSFSNSNFSIGDALITANLPSFLPPKDSVFQSIGFIVGVTIGVVLLVISFWIVMYFAYFRQRRKRTGKGDDDVEDWELEYWPHRIGYQEIFAATKAFSDENVIGSGGNGNVYKGVLRGGLEIAVKKISHESEHGMREFLAEVSSLGRLKHRNLVGLRGWCRNDKRSSILVYDYMENGSVDKRIFDCDEDAMLSWDERVKVLKDVASAIWYLHEGWEAKVLHRDIKASNVLLDRDMNARLGDFGLARTHHHYESASTTRVVGTVGYMAPELIKTGRASTQTDVFCFGVLILEIICGRRPIEEGKPGLIDWTWMLMERQELVSALDDRLKGKGRHSNEEVERLLQLGLLCAHPEAHVRPTMRQVMKLLEVRDEGAESEGEGTELNLLQRMRTATTIWESLSSRGHPTFNDIQRNISSSMSMSYSDVIREGR